ncbi:hypothetical protein E2C01_034419 [Portunus trituberculatus]|uniref:Uncharacterized protein n=1 Tax=Portunus trituberculatus TaxID=210409 RepID=A0A5B7F670_PORTR|nr:hypothetical protein [Portunus trituberculatus]
MLITIKFGLQGYPNHPKSAQDVCQVLRSTGEVQEGLLPAGVPCLHVPSNTTIAWSSWKFCKQPDKTLVGLCISETEVPPLACDAADAKRCTFASLMHNCKPLLQQHRRLPAARLATPLPTLCICIYRSSEAEMPLVFRLCQLGDLRRYYADFPWNDYCFHVRDPSLCAEHITEDFKLDATSSVRLSSETHTETFKVSCRLCSAKHHVGNNAYICKCSDHTSL